MRTTRIGWLLGLAGVLTAGCGEDKDGNGANRADTAAPAETRKAREAQSAGQADRSAPAPATPPAATAVAADASPDPKPEMRFDMTQDGEAQTAEQFDAWMHAQGVQVAEGAKEDSGDDARKPQSKPAEAKADDSGDAEPAR